ncbi:2-pyrone-4,6-dicarbaxylate hydrolase [Paraburkholderia sediminicola]|uniref:2-pyrone-4,6-dicarbaxylate hydrolase n=1 Tax=Paraburkholderia sediminicola TaxID=458836 RepID=A0A6J5CU15_9BURK|nr:amidohydrolase family protein [Paraburkholderia sediminicola]CAB3743750.1 2-pyrone-4,6-dicarbaxylate hydrolase [Paraburkholderia sediminicola]
MSHTNEADLTKLPFSPRPQHISRPSVSVPARATDTHFHIFGPQDKYPLGVPRMYNPQEATVENYRAMAATVGIQRVVVVQASVYSTDNRCLLDSIREFGVDRARGIAVIDTDTTDEELEALKSGGVRGIRFNAISGGTDLDQLSILAKRIEALGWHIQLWVKGEQLPALESRLLDLPVEISIDHIGQITPANGANSDEFQTLLRLLNSRRAWVKLSGYRASAKVYPHEDVKPFIQEMISAAPDRCVWGSDWPHPLLGTRAMPDVGKLMDLLADWAGTSAQFEEILVGNPARLYGF